LAAVKRVSDSFFHWILKRRTFQEKVRLKILEEAEIEATGHDLWWILIIHMNTSGWIKCMHFLTGRSISDFSSESQVAAGIAFKEFFLLV
jgi:hypothetical protein